MARASVAIVEPMAPHRVAFHAWAVVHTCGKDVAPGMTALWVWEKGKICRDGG